MSGKGEFSSEDPTGVSHGGVDLCAMWGTTGLVTAGVAEDGAKGRSLSLILGTKGSH